MKISIDRNELLKGLEIAQRISGKRSVPQQRAFSFLQCVTADNELCMTARDREMTMIAKLKAEIHEGGTVSLATDDFSSVVKNYPRGIISLSMDPGSERFYLRSGKLQFKLEAQQREEPDLPDFSYKKEFSFQFDPQTFSGMLKKTLVSVSEDPLRDFLCGVYFQVRLLENHILAVSTDGHRLTISKEAFRGSCQQQAGVTIPTRLLKEVKKLLDGGATQLEVGFPRNEIGMTKEIVFVVDNFVLCSSLIEGNFPDYCAVLPEPGKIKGKAVLSKEHFINALQRVSIIPGTTKDWRIKLTVDNSSELKMEGFNRMKGYAVEHIAIDSREGTDLFIDFNARYLLDALSSIESEKVSIEYIDNSNPLVVQPLFSVQEEETSVQEEETSVQEATGEPFVAQHSVIIMPMRLENTDNSGLSS